MVVFPFFSFFPLFFYSVDFNQGKTLFEFHCLSCHENGKNAIIPEKNLKKETLTRNGIDSFSTLFYQIMNGKNGMPAFGGRLNEKDLFFLSSYILEQTEW